MRFLVAIIEFIKDYTTEVNGIGHICSFTAFNINHKLNVDSIDDSIENNFQLQSNDSKFELSCINFAENYNNCNNTNDNHKLYQRKSSNSHAPPKHINTISQAI